MDSRMTLDLQGVIAATVSITALAGAVERLMVNTVKSRLTAAGASPAIVAAGGLEMSATMGWVTLAVAGLATAVAGATKIIMNAARTLSEFATNKASLGSTSGELGLLTAMGGAFGMDAVGAAVGFRSRVNSGGLAMATAGRYGIGPTPIDFGSNVVNEGKMLIDFLRGVAATAQSNPGQAQNDLRNVGLRQFSGIVQNPRLLNELERMGRELGELMTDDRIMAAMRFNVEMEKMKLAWQEFVIRVAPPVMKWLNSLADWLDRIVQAHPTFAAQIGLGGANSTHTQAINKQTQATIDNTSELRQLNGVYGGGHRARTAIPKAYFGTGYQIDDANARAARHWGSWSVAL